MLRAVGVHIFAGGFSLGIATRFTVVAHLERLALGRETWRANRPDVPRYESPTGDWPRLQAAVVYGNPPCSLFSPLRGNQAWSRRAPLYQAMMLDVVKVGLQARARAIVIENVRGFRTQPLGQSWLRLIYALVRERYWPTWLPVNARWWLPQRRPRVFLVLTRWRWHPVPAPALTTTTVLDVLHAVPLNGLPNGRDWPGWWRPELVDVLQHVAPGQSLAGLVPEHRNPIWAPRRLRPDVAGTVYGDRFIHPTEARPLVAREAARLMGYPDTWRFANPRTLWQEIGKSVCPPVAAWLAEQLSAQWHYRDERPSRPLDLHQWPDGIQS